MAKTVFWGFVLSLSVWIAWMFADNEPPYVYDAPKSFVEPDPAPQGSMITANWALKAVKRQCPATVQRIFRDSATRKVVSTLDTTEASRSVRLGDDNLPRSFQLPSNLPQSVNYSAIVCFECNAVQKVWPMCVLTPEITFRTQPPHSPPAN